MFDSAIDKYVSTPALCEFMAPDLDKTKDCRIYCKAVGHVWAIAARYEHDLVMKNIKLTR